MVYDEAALVEERENGRIVTEAVLLQLAVASMLSKKAKTDFTKRIKSLSVDVKPREGLFDEKE